MFSKQPLTLPSPEPDEFITFSQFSFFRIHFKLILSFKLKSPKLIFFFSFSNYMFHGILSSLCVLNPYLRHNEINQAAYEGVFSK